MNPFKWKTCVKLEEDYVTVLDHISFPLQPNTLI